MSTELQWLMDNFREDTPGVQHALLLSHDGLRLACDATLDGDRADHLAAIASGLYMLSEQTSVHFDGGGSVQTVLLDLPKLQLLAVAAGDGAVLTVLAEAEADPGVVGTAMKQLVDQLFEHLRVNARPAEAQQDAQPETQAS